MKRILLGTAMACLLAMPAQAAGFRESRAWNFEDPITKSVKLAKEQTRLMHKNGGFGPGNNYVAYQYSTNIQNQNNIGIENNSGDIDIDIEQDGGTQSASDYVNTGDVDNAASGESD